MGAKSNTDAYKQGSISIRGNLSLFEMPIFVGRLPPKRKRHVVIAECTKPHVTFRYVILAAKRQTALFNFYM
jgi:hypothetical protein